MYNEDDCLSCHSTVAESIEQLKKYIYFRNKTKKNGI